MIIEKKIKLQVNVGISTTGSSGRYLNVDIRDESVDIEDILDDICIYLLKNYTNADLEDLITSEDGIYIRIHADQVSDDGISYSDYMKGIER